MTDMPSGHGSVAERQPEPGGHRSILVGVHAWIASSITGVGRAGGS